MVGQYMKSAVCFNATSLQKICDKGTNVIQYWSLRLWNSEKHRQGGHTKKRNHNFVIAV